MRLEVEDILDNINIKSANSHLQLLVSTIWVDKNCSVIADNEIRSKVYSMAVAEASNSLQEIILRIESHDHIISKSNRSHLINALVQCFRLIDVIKLGQKGRNIRNLNRIQTSIREIIRDLFNLGEHEESEIIRRIHDLVPNISAITYSGN